MGLNEISSPTAIPLDQSYGICLLAFLLHIIIAVVYPPHISYYLVSFYSRISGIFLALF